MNEQPKFKKGDRVRMSKLGCEMFPRQKSRINPNRNSQRGVVKSARPGRVIILQDGYAYPVGFSPVFWEHEPPTDATPNEHGTDSEGPTVDP